MYISRKTQLILTNYQKELIDEMIYVRRNIWNKLIETYNPIIIQNLENKKRPVLPNQTELNQFSKGLELPKVNNRVYKSCIDDYLQAWKMCFKIKQRRKPRFHSYKSIQRVNFSSMGDRLSLKENFLILPTKQGGKTKDKKVTFKEDLSEFNDIPIPVFAIEKRNDKYYISLTFNLKDYEKEKSQENQVGCDWGVKTFLTTSDGKQYDLPEKLIRQEIKIKNLQRILSNKQRNSKNYNKIRLKLNQAWFRYTNIRKDFIEKLSYKLLSENKLIALENLDIQEMINKSHRNRRKNIYKNSFNIFKTRLVQKSERFESQVIFVDKYFPSSQLCSNCGDRKQLKLTDRIYECGCGINLDRDLNAAINILKEGIRMNSMAVGLQS